MKVLIVEDDPVLAITLQEQVQAAGHQVCGWATRAEDANEMARTHRPDLVILDAVLDSFVSGVEAVSAIRQAAPCQVAFVSTGDPIAQEVLRDLDPVGIITAPPQQDQVVDLLRRAADAGPPRERRRR